MNFRDFGDGATILTAPLGPITYHEEWKRIRGTYSHHEGKEHIEFWLDQYRNEYSSIGHVLRCAIAKELGL